MPQWRIVLQDIVQSYQRDHEEKILLKGAVLQLVEENRKKIVAMDRLTEVVDILSKRVHSGDIAATPPKRQRTAADTGVDTPATDTGTDTAGVAKRGSNTASDGGAITSLTLLTTANPMFQAAEKASNKKILVSTLLRDLFESGALAGGTRLPHTKLGYILRENSHQYVGVMNLVEKVWTKEQEKLLRTSVKDIPNVDATQLEDALTSIDKLCKEKMAELEGKEVGRTTALFTGLGARYVAWKNKKEPKVQSTLVTNFFTKAVQYLSPSKKK